jgi:hypothetical protein
MHAFVFVIFFILTMIVSGVAYGRKRYGLAVFAAFWAGYNFCMFIKVV